MHPTELAYYSKAGNHQRQYGAFAQELQRYHYFDQIADHQ